MNFQRSGRKKMASYGLEAVNEPLEEAASQLSLDSLGDHKNAPYSLTFSRVRCICQEAYQAFYGLNHYNHLETGSFLIRKLNQSTSCPMLQFKGKNTLPFDSNFK